MNNIKLEKFQGLVTSYIEVVISDELNCEDPVDSYIVKQTDAIFKAAMELKNQKNESALNEIKNTVTTILKLDELVEKGKAAVLAKILKAFNDKVTCKSSEEMGMAIKQNIDSLLTPPPVPPRDCSPPKASRLSQAVQVLPPIPPPRQAAAAAISSPTQAKPSFSRDPSTFPCATRTTAPATPVGKMDPSKLAFLSQGKDIRRCYDPKELDGVNVKELRAKLEALFAKQKDTIIERRNRVLKKIKDEIKADDIYKKAMGTAASSLKFDLAFEQVHENIVQCVHHDLNERMISLDKIKADPEVLKKIEQDIHIMVDIPQDMSIEEFTALSYIYRSYEQCLLEDAKKWTLTLEKRLQISAILTTLNFYMYFYQNLTRIQSVSGWEKADKHIRELETNDAIAMAVEFPHCVKNEEAMAIACSDYVENGCASYDALYTPPPFRQVGTTRLDPPAQTPKWITEALKKD